jgi:DNA (cytosine-5)-methyltransferase 1
MRTSGSYYNEFDKHAAAWLRELIKRGLIADGEVDERNIEDVRPDELVGFRQIHLFAGIGGWSNALRLAGWDDSKEVLTVSCPCQPYSTAGKGKGITDERHLWPAALHIISQRKPTAIFGEQVASAITHGWFDDVSQGLEAQGYSVGAAVLPASAAGRGHSRDRLFFVGYSEYDGLSTTKELVSDGSAILHDQKRTHHPGELTGASDICVMADPLRCGRQGSGQMEQSVNSATGSDGEANKFVDAGTGLWWIECPDGYARPVEPSIPMLAYGIRPELVKCASRGFGNAIVPTLAAEFIRATL